MNLPRPCSRIAMPLVRATALALSLTWLVGCDPGASRKWEWWRPTAKQGVENSVNTPGGEGPAASALPRQFKVRFNVLRIDAPGGGLEQASDIWTHVNAAALPWEQAATLRDNGFRIGVGTEAAREPIQRRIAAVTGVCSKLDHALPGMNRAVEMFITEAERDWTLFFVSADGQMAGQSFDDARAVIRYTWTVDPDGSDAVAVRVEPEMRQAPGQMRFQRADERWQYRPEYRGRVFRELAFEAVIPKGGFLMLGPTDEATRLPLLARPFFVEPSSGRQRESLYIISPIVEPAGYATTQSGPEMASDAPIGDASPALPPGE